MEFDLGRVKGSIGIIGERVRDFGSHLGETSPTQEFTDFIAQLHEGFPEDHPLYGIPAGGHLNEEGTHRIHKGKETGWYEVRPDPNSPVFFAYQVRKDVDGNFSIGDIFRVDPNI